MTAIEVQVKEIFKESRFGRLKCIDIVGKSNNGSNIWLCVCDCGNHIYVNEKMLTIGVQRCCGCKPGRSKNLQGHKFDRLTVVEPTGKKEPDGSINWLCRCECGKTVCVSSNKLLTGHTKSCGCLASEVLAASRTYVDGTCLEQVVSKNISVNNTSGIKGVYQTRGRWGAYIAYAGVTYHLGRFSSIEDAEVIRKAAEKIRIEHVKLMCCGRQEYTFADKILDFKRRIKSGKISSGI